MNSNRSEVTTGRSCEPSRRNTGTGKANGSKEEIKTLNAFLDRLQIKVYEAHSQLMGANELITAETLRNKFQGKAEKCMTLIDVFKDHNQKMESLVGSEFKKGTAERYRTSLKHTMDFLTWKYDLIDIEIKKVDYTFISEYDYYLRSIVYY